MEAVRRKKLLDAIREELRIGHFSPSTEKSYVLWIRRFVRHHGMRHPHEMSEPEVTAFLNWLAQERKISASSQNQALAAILFLYKRVLKLQIPELDGVVRARRPARLPVVLTRAEVRAVLANLAGTPEIMARLLYGAGLRVMECCRLRVKDLDLERREIQVLDGKGRHARRTMVPDSLADTLRRHLAAVREQHDRDLRAGFRRFDVLDQMARINCPTLVCVGDLDPVTPVEASRELFDGLPSGIARLEVIEGAGHFPWKDAPDRYWAIIEEFVGMST